MAFFLRIIATSFTGPDLATFITFYPFVMFSALFGGFGPGMLTTVASALIVDYWLLPPNLSLAITNLYDLVGIMLFVLMGMMISGMVEYYRRRQATEQRDLRQAMIYNRSLLEASIDPLITLNRQGKITDANEAAALARNIPKEKLIGSNFSDYSTESEKAKVGYEQAFVKGFVSNYPLTIRRDNGKQMDVLCNITVYKDERGVVLGVLVAARDLTEQVKITQQLNESYASLEQRVQNRTLELKNANIAAQNVLDDLRVEKEVLAKMKVKDDALLSSIGDGVIAVDPDKKIILMNKAAENILGWKINDVIGKNYDEIVILEDENGAITSDKMPIAKVLLNSITTSVTPAVISASLYIVCKNKIKIPVAITVSPVVLDNTVIGAIEIFHDISHEKEVDKAKSEFVSLASHQLRTPLTAISWYTEMILKGDVGKIDPKQKKYLDEIYKGNKRMIGLVNTLLNVSRIELGTFAILPQKIKIQGVLQEMVREIKHLATDKKIKLVENYEKNLPEIIIDPKLIQIISENLLSNAVKYTPHGGQVSLMVMKKGPSLLISVKDTGYGIPKKQQSQVFKKLFRADNIRTKDTEGTGLGLYIVKAIIVELNGKIWFDSVENEGSTFFVEIPLKGVPKKEGTKALEDMK